MVTIVRNGATAWTWRSASSIDRETEAALRREPTQTPAATSYVERPRVATAVSRSTMGDPRP
jgi:hypothetical protein